MLYQTIKKNVESEGFTVLSDGLIMDDINDYRPGVKARNEEGVRSLLQEAGLYKSEIRELAKRAGVTNWNKTPSCSLASRFPYGTRITPEKVEAVFKAEEYFTKRGFEPVRVRVHQDLARIEVGADQIEKLVKNHEEINKMMQDLGFLFVTVDLQGYKYGRMNDQLDEKTKKAALE